MVDVQEEFQLALFKNRKKENLFANRVGYFIDSLRQFVLIKYWLISSL